MTNVNTDRREELPPEFSDPEFVVFGGKPSPEPGVAADHAFDALRRLVARDISEVRNDFTRVGRQITEIVSSVPATVGEFEMDEVSFELGFSSSGRLVFIAEAGIEATIGVKFKRKPRPSGGQ